MLKKNTYLGGKLHSEYEQGFIMETGADSIVARHQGVMELVEELNFKQDLVYNETGISYIYTNNELHAIPADSTFGIPMSLHSLEESTLVSEEGKKRSIKGFDIAECRLYKRQLNWRIFNVLFGGGACSKPNSASISRCVFRRFTSTVDCLDITLFNRL